MLYIEQKSVEELCYLVNEKGYFSEEADRIQGEIEYSKRQYEKMIQQQRYIYDRNKEAICVVKYYLYLLQQLKHKFPYDAMGCEITVPLLILEEFQKKDIAKRIVEYTENRLELDRQRLRGEIQKFITVQLDPRGIALYMDILRQSNLRLKQGGE